MKVLIFGGNGFIGAEMVEALLNAGVADVIVVNRGLSWDWDTPSRIQPRVKCFEVDRDNPLSDNPDFCQYVKENHFDATVDFSGYSPQAVQQSFELVTGRTDLYVYISSDSVYEVCREKTHVGPSRETDAVRPENEDDRSLARKRDSYGDDKLTAEEEIRVLHRSQPDAAPPYLILRLADVIGPRDSTNRLWQYQLWMEMAAKHSDVQVYTPKKYEGRPLSFVFSKDVASLICHIVHTDKKSRSSVLNESYNLACKERVSLGEFLKIIQISLGLKNVDVQVKTCEGDEVPQIFPSVERGPIDISKATDKLQWSPTSLTVAIDTTVKFNANVVQKRLYLQERKSVAKDLKECLEDVFDKQTIKEYLKEMLFLK